MSTKKRGHRTLEEFLERPWCYYCERDFDDQKILVNHQRQKHFKCHNCTRRLNTAGGLSVHMAQVHKETLEKIDDALPGREKPDAAEVFGMVGIPEDAVHQYEMKARARFAEENPQGLQGSRNGSQPGSKRPKLDMALLKQQIAARKAAKQAGEQGQASSKESTPAAPSPNPMPAYPVQQASPPPAMYGQPYAAPAPFPGAPQPYGQPAYPLAPQQPPMPWFNGATGVPPVPGMPGLPAAPLGMPYGYPPPVSSVSPPVGHGYGIPPQPTGLPARPSFSAPQTNSPAPAANSTPTAAAESKPAQSTSDKAEKADKAENATKAGNAPAAAPEKRAKKETRLVYSDDKLSPEEKMAQLPRYAYTPPRRDETVLGPVEGAVTGVVAGPDDVVDRQG